LCYLRTPVAARKYRSLSAAGEAMKVALRGPNIPESVKATGGWSF
jgi:hypothetical protein